MALVRVLLGLQSPSAAHSLVDPILDLHTSQSTSTPRGFRYCKVMRALINLALKEPSAKAALRVLRCMWFYHKLSVSEGKAVSTAEYYLYSTILARRGALVDKCCSIHTLSRSL